MEKPDFEEIGGTLLGYSQNLRENSRIGESKLVLAIAEMIRVMAWQSSQQDTSNIQIAHLIDEMKLLRGTIEEANEKSGKLDQANYRMQVSMVTLTAIGTLIIAFPILKALFQWLAAIAPTTFPFSASAANINVLSGILAAGVGALSFWQSSRAFLRKEKKK